MALCPFSYSDTWYWRTCLSTMASIIFSLLPATHMPHNGQVMMLSGKCRCRLGCSIRQVLSLCHAHSVVQKLVHHCRQDCLCGMCDRHRAMMTCFSCVGSLAPLQCIAQHRSGGQHLLTHCQPKMLPVLHADLHYL